MFCVSSQWYQRSISWNLKNFEQPWKKLLRKRRCWQGALLSFFSQLQARWDLWWCLVFPQLRWAIFINFDVHTTALFSPVKVHQRVRNFATKSQNRAKFRVLYGCAKKGTGLKKVHHRRWWQISAMVGTTHIAKELKRFTNTNDVTIWSIQGNSTWSINHT